jgi:hypothetical protein
VSDYDGTDYWGVDMVSGNFFNMILVLAAVIGLLYFTGFFDGVIWF